MAGAFSRKTSGISCDLTAFRKIKELRANAVETPLGVTGVLLSKGSGSGSRIRTDGGQKYSSLNDVAV